MRINARDLKVGDFVRSRDGTGEIKDIKLTNPPILIGGEGLKQAVAIRITLTNGETLLCHPGETITRTIDTEQSTILPFART